MKRKILSIVFALAMVINLSVVCYAQEEVWTPKASDWAMDELLKAQQADLVPEILKDKDLTQKATREEFAEISVKVYEALSKKEAEAVSENPFTDTKNTQILKAYGLGITNGMTETTFEPDSFLTREQAAVMLARAYEKAFELDTLPEYEAPEAFADDDMISDWAKEAVYYMAANGIITGMDDNMFAPKYNTEEEEESGYGSATREQALLIAVRIYDKFADAQDETAADENDETDNQPADETNVQTPEEEEQKDESETDADKEDYTIGFIGGSLTQGGSTWINAVKNFFAEKYPDKNIVTINAGIGGTGSQMGATRYEKDILDYDPDLVFIEFAVNDTGASEDDSKIYMEAMVRQSLKAAKVPNIIFLYAPQPCEKDSELYTKWSNGVQWKEEIATHYGIKSINIYDYMYDEFTEEQKENRDLTFTDYLSDYYQESGTGFNVHGGYSKYAEAIVKELTDNFDECMTQPKNTSVKTNSTIANYRYEHVFASSSRMNYTNNDWDLYTKSNKYNGGVSEYSIPDSFLAFPYFPDGVSQTETNGAMFGYETTAGATAICVSYVSSTKGATASVTIDEQSAGTISCNSIYQGVNYQTAWIELPKDGKSHKVIFTVNIDGSTAGVFRFGSVVERFDK